MVFSLLFPSMLQKKAKILCKIIRSHVLFECFLQALAAVESVMSEAWIFACFHEPGAWQHLDKGDNRCFPHFIFCPHWDILAVVTSGAQRDNLG